MYAVEDTVKSLKEAITYLVAGPITDLKPHSELLVVSQENHYSVSASS